MRLAALFLSVWMVLSLAACAGQNEAAGAADSGTAAETVTTPAIGTETEEAIPVNRTSAITTFDTGKITYQKEVITQTDGDYPDAKLGERMTKKTAGAVVLFDEDFENTDDPALGGKAVPRTEGSVGVSDGQLLIPFDGDDITAGGWTTWCPDVNTNFDDYKQIQLSANLEIYGGTAVTGTGLIGCYVDNYTFSIADNSHDGIWLAFLKDECAIAVLGSDEEHWAWTEGGNVTVPVADDALYGPFALDIVCTPDRTTYVYVNEALVLRLQAKNDRITVWDAEGTEVYTEAYDMDAVSGSHYSIFCHGGGFMIEDMQVYGAGKGAVSEEVRYTATPAAGETLGLDITDRNDLVGICYTMWFNAIHGNGTEPITEVYNVSELEEKYGFSAKYGFGNAEEQHNAVTAFHYWAEPAQGYYRSTDKQAARNNLTLLQAAGVDFLILDFTFAGKDFLPGTSAWKTYIYGPMTTLLDTIMEMRTEGLETPYVVMWVNNDVIFDAVWTYFYSIDSWKDCFVYWNGKPFIMEWNCETTETDTFTVRGMYGLQGSVSQGQWSYLEHDNAKTVALDAAGNPEHICVCVAAQQTYMSNTQTAQGRAGGTFWNEQWKNAFAVRPKIVSVTWWNEWCAQLYEVNGSYVFTDNFNQEYSRDIEPMKGGHGDQYYRWLCEYIRAYRAHEACPDLTEQ